jgi:RNA polymerase sigma-70 factor (ECF subfamily)
MAAGYPATVTAARHLAGIAACSAVTAPGHPAAAGVAALLGSWGATSRGDVVEKFRASDRLAAEELFNACYPRLAGWIRRLVDDDDTAHEIASEAFTRLLGRWSALDNPQSYLYMIATNLIRDHWRKAGRERRALRAVRAVPAARVSHPVQDVDVRALIASLPDRLRQPFLLYHYAGFPVREVAALLNRPEGTVKAELHAARARLRAALGDRDD